MGSHMFGRMTVQLVRLPGDGTVGVITVMGDALASQG